MFLRFKQDNAVRTVNLNHVTQIHKIKFWANQDAPYMIRIDLSGNYAVVADKLTSDQADALEEQLLEVWTQKRGSIAILEVNNENLPA